MDQDVGDEVSADREMSCPPTGSYLAAYLELSLAAVRH